MLQLVTAAVFNLCSGCSDDLTWLPVKNGVLVLDTIATKYDGAFMTPTGVSYTRLHWWRDRLICREQLVAGSTDATFLSEVLLDSFRVRPLVVEGYSHIVDVAEDSGSEVMLINNDGYRVLYRGPSDGTYRDIGLPSLVNLGRAIGRRVLAVSKSNVLLLGIDSVYVWKKDRNSWAATSTELFAPFNWNICTEILPIDSYHGTEFAVAMDMGEWDGGAYRLRVLDDGSVVIDSTFFDENCQFLFSDRMSRLWMVGGLQHMGVNLSRIKIVGRRSIQNVMHQCAPWESKESTRLQTYHFPTITIHEHGLVTGAFMTDSVLTFYYHGSGIYSVPSTSETPISMSSLRLILRVEDSGPFAANCLIADDRRGGMILAPAYRGLVWVKDLQTKPRYTRTVRIP